MPSKFAPPPSQVVRRPHGDPRYLCFTGFGYVYRYCPRCDCSPDGWHADGSPRYRGGFLIAESPEGYSYTVACDCQQGELRREQQGIQRFDQMPPSWRLVSEPLPVVWDRWSMDRPNPELPPALPPDRQEEFAGLCSRQLERFFAKKLTLEQLATNLHWLTEKYSLKLPDAPAPAPVPAAFQAPVQETLL